MIENKLNQKKAKTVVFTRTSIPKCYNRCKRTMVEPYLNVLEQQEEIKKIIQRLHNLSSAMKIPACFVSYQEEDCVLAALC